MSKIKDPDDSQQTLLTDLNSNSDSNRTQLPSLGTEDPLDTPIETYSSSSLTNSQADTILKFDLAAVEKEDIVDDDLHHIAICKECWDTSSLNEEYLNREETLKTTPPHRFWVPEWKSGVFSNFFFERKVLTGPFFRRNSKKIQKKLYTARALHSKKILCKKGSIYENT